MSRRGRSLPANPSGCDPHRASISGRFGQVDAVLSCVDVTVAFEAELAAHGVSGAFRSLMRVHFD
eukprot:COSAG01_NODE_7146_length_3331_cov_7.400062_4_plen_65_part_00